MNRQEFEHRVYAHAVGPETTILPADFRHRLVELEVGAARVHCLAPVDLAYSKLAAGREKDLEFVAGLLHHNIVRRGELERAIADANVNLRAVVEGRLRVVLTELARRRESIRRQRRGRGHGMGI